MRSHPDVGNRKQRALHHELLVARLPQMRGRLRGATRPDAPHGHVFWPAAYARRCSGGKRHMGAAPAAGPGATGHNMTAAAKQRPRRGRPPKLLTLVRKHTGNTETLIAFLAAVATGRLPASTHDRVAAARELLDRAYGRPTAPVEVAAHVETNTRGVLVVPGMMSTAEWSKAASEYTPAVDDEQHAPRLVAVTQQENNTR